MESTTLGNAVYGEILLQTMIDMMEYLKANEHETFLDLGHGTGKLPMLYTLRKILMFC